MKLCYLLILGQFLISTAFAKNGSSDQEAIRYAKAIPVVKLDSELPSKALDDWLRVGPPHVDEVLWRVSPGCDLNEPEAPAPLCVRFTFRRRSISGWGLIKVGTIASGVSGAPTVEYVTVLNGEKQVTAGAPQGARLIKKLSELPQVLDDMSVQAKPNQKGHH
jgi:hypothetical protein